MQLASLETKSWGTDDFVRHYRKGRGKGVTLSQIGLFNRFKAHRSVRAETDTWIVLQKNLMRIKALTLRNRYRSSNRPIIESRVEKNSRTEFTSTDRFWPVSPLYSIGNSSFFMTSQWKLFVEPRNSVFRYEGYVEFSIRDRFADPLSFRNIGLGEVEVGGTPYEITQSWRVRLNGKEPI